MAPKLAVICPQQPLPPGAEVQPKPDTVTLNRRPAIAVKFAEAVDRAKVVMQVDNDDVTTALQEAEGRFVYTPQADLRPGIHRISVQGGPAPLEWCFAQRKFEELEDLSAAGEISATGEYALRKPAQENPRATVTGNAHLVGRLADGDAVATTEWNIRYEGNWNPTRYQQEPVPQSTLPHGVVDSVNVPNFRSALNYKQQSGELGDVAIQESNLVAPSFLRRGLQLKLGHPFWNAEGHFFGGRPQVDNTSEHLTGLDDANERLFGGSVAFSPFNVDPSLLRLKTSYVWGTSQDQGAPSIATTSAEQSGNTLGFVGNSTVFENRLRAEGEYAISRFNQSIQSNTGHKWDRAGRARLDFQDSTLQLLEKPVQFRLGGEYNFIGIFYGSITNPGIQTDRQGVSGEGGAGWGPANVNLNASRFHDNVKDLEIMPRVYTTARGVGLALAQPDWPSLTLGVTRTSQQSTGEPFDAVNQVQATRVDNIVNALTSQVSYAWRFLSINTGVTKTQTLDYTRRTRNSNVLAFNGGLNLNLFDGRIVLSPTISYTTTETLPTDDQTTPVPGSSFLTRTTVYTVTATGVILPAELTFDGQFSLTDTNSKSENGGLIAGATVGSRTVITNAVARLTWNFEKYLWNYGRQALSFRVNWNRNVDAFVPTNDRNDLGFFLILDVFAPFLF